jgi:hypothetical protein
MKYLLITLAISFSYLSPKASAQTESPDPGWQWARLSNLVNEFRSLGIRTNFNNDIYSFCWYIDTIYIEDTAFIHPGGSPTLQDFNVALIKRDSKGNFIKACDLITPQNSAIWIVDVEIDNESNIIVYGTFEDTLFVNDVILTVPGDDGVNLFLIKMDSDFNFKWGSTISSPYQDECGRLAISKDNYYYLSANHMHNGSDTVSRMAYYLGQDSAYVEDGLNSLLKIDSEGALIWRKEIHDPHIGSAYVWNTVFGQDGLIYLKGNATNDIIIEGDTLKHPTFPDYCDCGFIVQFDEEGNHHNSFFMYRHLSLYYHQVEIDQSGNYYLSGIFQDSLLLGNDTITLLGDTIGYVILKMDASFKSIWYEYIKIKIGNQVSPYFRIKLYGDSLAFAFSTTKNFTFAGIDFNFGNSGEVLEGLFDPEGELVSYQTTDATFGTNVYWMCVDNCGNLIFDGSFKGTGFYGADTLIAADPYSLYLVKNERIKPILLVMPADTTGCGTITLYAPEGYLYYQWNDELSNQNWFIVNSSGIVNIKAANEYGCWAEGETTVGIYPVIGFSLGPDMTILLTDTLELSAPDGYEYYLWSTGDTIPQLVIPATDLQIGNNLIWLDINNGPCDASDTIMIKVVDNSLIQENSGPDILIYPNPVETNFRIISPSGDIPECVVIYNCGGKEVMKLYPANNTIDVRSLQQGVYIGELIFHEYTIKRKIIIL